MRPRPGLWALRAGAILLAALSAAAEDAPPPGANVDLRWAVRIPMRDGVALNATIFRPKGQKDPLPAIFTLTPYIADSYLDRAFYFAAHGYVFALVDVRGRGNSGGATHPGVDFPFQYGIFAPYDMQWLTFTAGVTGNANLFGSAAFWAAKAREYYEGHTAFEEYDRVVGNPSAIFRKWIAHPAPDAYYDAMVPSPDQYSRIRIPVLTITGHYDGDQPGALVYYGRHMQYGTAEAKKSHYLIVGPWDHAGTRTPKPEVGGLKFGAASVLDLNDLHRQWYDWTMKGGARPAFLKARVAYYLVGADEWKYADSLEDIGAERRLLYLDSSGGLQHVFRSGSLEDKPGAGPPDTWTYDPLDTRPGEAELDEEPAYLTSQRLVMNLFGNGAVYHGEPVDRTTEVTGKPRLTLWLSMDVPDTDLEALLYEVLPDGGSVLLTGATLRARYRESPRREIPVPIARPVEYELHDFTFFSRRIAKGSRLRLLVHCVNSISAEKNYNSGGVVAAETGHDARTAHVTLLHDAEHPSTLELPVVTRNSP